MIEKLKLWSERKVGTDGRVYEPRLLLTESELTHYQKVGVVGVVDEIIGMQDAADALVGGLELECHLAEGGEVQ